MNAWVHVVPMTCLLCAFTHAAEPLQCPEGTRLETRTIGRQEFSERCVNAEGKRHGPQRDFRDGRLAAEGVNDAATGRSEAKIYDAEGVLTDELTLQGREITSRRLTRAGMEQLVASLNEARRLEPPSAWFRVIDERNIGVDFHFPDADPEHGAQKLRLFERYVWRNFCAMLTGAEEIDSLEVRVLEERDLPPAMTTRLTRESCTVQLPK